MKYKTKNVLKKVLAVGLACVIGIGAIAGISALANKSDDDGKVKISPSYSIGGLDSNGKYVESDATLYTKDAFECQGLTIKPDFDSNVQYQIFFYDEVGQFIESTGVLNTTYNDEVPFGSSRARLEITPVWGEDVKEKDQIIKWYNKHQWTNSLEIKVNEEQVALTLTNNLCEVDSSMAGKYYGSNLTTFVDHEAITSSKLIEVDNYSQVKIIAPTSNSAAVTCIAQFFDSNGNNLEFPIAYFDFEATNGNVKVFDIPSKAKYFSFALITAVADDYQIYFA